MATFNIEIEEAGDEPVTFTLSGKKLSDGKRWKEEFTSLRALPIGAVVDLGEGVLPAADAAAFVEACLEDKSAARFGKLIRDRDRVVTAEALADTTRRLYAEMMGRPTKPPVDSAGGPDDTGATSTDGSSSAAPTSEPSTPVGS